MGEFAADFEIWFYRGRRRDAVLEQRLAEEFIRAWQSGDRDDRSQALSFAYWTRKQTGFHLFTEALRDADPEIAEYAASLACSLIMKHYDLGESIGIALTEFGHRFPEARSVCDAALKYLAPTGEG
ncbi:MAG TPA: hypothetical protein VJB57_09715 [Dehalococcoidia bacterium]|nr:hypothetical protein [Dehalococcoidia bacterium]